MKRLKFIKLGNRFVGFGLLVAAISIALRIGFAYADSAYTVSGQITFGSTPITNANISYGASGSSGGSATTDTNGDYSISSVPNGSYAPTLVAYGNGTTTPSVLEALGTNKGLVVNGADATQNLSFNTAYVTVTVRDGNGNLASNASVNLSSAQLGSFTDSTGAFNFLVQNGVVSSTVETNSDGVALAVLVQP